MPGKARRTPPKKQDSDSASQEALFSRYNALVDSGKIQDDQAQRQVLEHLSRLARELELRHKPQLRGLSRFFKTPEKPAELRGIYVWGSVGRGKSMLMDLFFEHVPIEKKRRVHFHAFMQEVHARIHELRQSHAHSKSGADPVISLAQQIAAETSLLCFDELQATDVTDATLLFRLFDTLFSHGVLVVSTSNRPPESLYTGGVQAERFAKFIGLIGEHMEVLSLDSEQDYRYAQGQSSDRRYVYPLGHGASQFIEKTIEALCKNPTPIHASLTVQGRHIPFQLYDGTIGRFTFAELCENMLGPADYLAIARKIKVMILTDIPKLSAEKRNEAKRFVTLIDALYEHRVKLIVTAEAPPERLYAEGDGAFEFQRTVSRLIEMQSANWGRHE